jgi:hypothetical protein
VRFVSFPGIIDLALSGRGPKRGFLFDPHRLALPCWALAKADAPAVLVTFDRHFDLVVPTNPPSKGLTAGAYDEHARHQLDERNVDHIFAAMEAGLVSDVIAIARAWPLGAWREPTWTSSDGVVHHIYTAPTLDRLLDDRRSLEVLLASANSLLDFDLDCFVTPSDADPFTLVPWPKDLIHDFLFPRGCEPFWDAALGQCRALTFAREPNHCGGVIASNRLFEKACEVIFEVLLKTDLP